MSIIHPAPTARPYDDCPADGCAGRICVIERTERVYRVAEGWSDVLDEYLLWCNACDAWSAGQAPDEACTPGGLARVNATIDRAEASKVQPPEDARLAGYEAEGLGSEQPPAGE